MEDRSDVSDEFRTTRDTQEFPSGYGRSTLNLGRKRMGIRFPHPSNLDTNMVKALISAIPAHFFSSDGVLPLKGESWRGFLLEPIGSVLGICDH